MNANQKTKELGHELEKRYLTQEEVALRFRVSQSTVKNWREKGLLEYLQPTGSTRVLYPRNSVEEFERQHTKKARLLGLRRPDEIKREVHGMSSDPREKERRI
jgi:DNA-binding transcriptional MerR regulator